MSPEMVMIPDWAFQFAVTGFGFLAAFLLRTLHNRATALEKRDAEMRETVARDYVSKADIGTHNSQVLARLDDIRRHVERLEFRLDNKKDKGDGT